MERREREQGEDGYSTRDSQRSAAGFEYSPHGRIRGPILCCRAPTCEYGPIVFGKSNACVPASHHALRRLLSGHRVADIGRSAHGFDCSLKT